MIDLLLLIHLDRVDIPISFTESGWFILDKIFASRGTIIYIITVSPQNVKLMIILIFMNDAEPQLLPNG
jgi:hypothetical protein